MSGNNGAGDLEVIPSDVTAYARRVYAIADQLRSALTQIDQAAAGLQSSWRGSAADSYGAGWVDVHEGATEVWDALFELAAKLGVTAETFTTTDTVNASKLHPLDLP